MDLSKRGEVKLADLQAIVKSIFDHIQTDLGIDTVTLEHDMYWNVSNGQRFDMTQPPSDLQVGQLYDDWEFLKPILEDPRQAVSLMLAHAAPLLEYIGKKVGQ